MWCKSKRRLRKGMAWGHQNQIRNETGYLDEYEPDVVDNEDSN